MQRKLCTFWQYFLSWAGSTKWPSADESSMSVQFQELLPDRVTTMDRDRQIDIYKLKHKFTECVTDLDKLNLVKFVLGTSQLSLLLQLPKKVNLASKIVKSDSKIIILLRSSKPVTHSYAYNTLTQVPKTHFWKRNEELLFGQNVVVDVKSCQSLFDWDSDSLPLADVVTALQGSISPTFYEQLLRTQIPTAQKRQSS